MTCECHVRFCERLGVRLPGPTHLLAAMYWNGCRHPKALWCEPLHPATGVVRWLSGFDVVEQSEDARYILAKLAARVGWIEYESLKLVREMRDKRRVVAMLPELLQ
jgi:hypothetical protein